MIITFPEIKVMYVKSDNGIAGGRKAFDKLESKLSTLKGRKFYGLVFGIPPNDEYRACVETEDENESSRLNLNTYIIPGGKFIQERIKNWNDNLHLIGETFQKLAHQYQVDNTRPSVEFYRSMRDMLITLPIK